MAATGHVNRCDPEATGGTASGEREYDRSQVRACTHKESPALKLHRTGHTEGNQPQGKKYAIQGATVCIQTLVKVFLRCLVPPPAVTPAGHLPSTPRPAALSGGAAVEVARPATSQQRTFFAFVVESQIDPERTIWSEQ